jgi:hypothetical protein
MGASRDDFTKYPRTPHLFGSRGADDDKHLSQQESLAFIADSSLIVEEKLDGTNVGIHFTPAGRMASGGFAGRPPCRSRRRCCGQSRPSDSGGSGNLPPAFTWWTRLRLQCHEHGAPDPQPMD